MTKDNELAKQLGLLFGIEHPLNILVKEFGAKLLISPHLIFDLLAEEDQAELGPIVTFARTQGAKIELVPVEIGGEQLVGFMPANEDAEPIRLKDGSFLGVLNISSVNALLSSKEEVVQPRRVEEPRVKKNENRLRLPKTIQEINQALSTHSPVLGNLEIKPNPLNPRLYTIHEKGTEVNGLTSVSMYSVNKYTNSRKGKSKTSSSTRHVVGFYLPSKKELESVDLLVKKIDDLKKKLARKKHKSGTVASFGMESELDISVITEEQLEEWRKTSYFTELKPYKEKAASLEKIYRLMKKQVGNGVQIQVQHITNGEADLVFVPEGARLPSELSAFDVAVEGLGGETKVVERVVGVMCIPDNISEKEKKIMANKVSKSLRLLYTSKSFAGKMPNILAVDNKLLEYWQKKIKNKEPILEHHQQKDSDRSLFKKETGEMVGLADVTSIDFYSYEPNKPGIGAKFMQLIIKYGDGHEERLTLDHGAQFDDFPWDGISKPSFASGMESYEAYLPPGQVKFWRRTLELRQAQEQGLRFFSPDNPLARDLALRVGIDQFVDLASRLGYWNNRHEIRREFQDLQMPNVHHLGVFYSHGHVDHFGWGGLLSTNIPVITADASLPFFETMFLAGSGGFASEAIFRRERDTLLTKASRRIYTPPLYLPEPYQEIRLGRGQVGITLLPASHSIYGGVMAKVVVYGKNDKPLKTIVYTGDFNFDNTEIMDETEKHLLDVDTLITDTTNLRPGAYNKPSVSVTREIMEQGFRQALTKADDSTVIEMAWHNLADVHLIAQIASELGQSSYVYPKMAILLHLLHQLDETRQRSEQNYNWRSHNPVPRLGVGVYPWIYPKMSFKKGERMLMESMDVATHATLSGSKQHVLFAPPNPMLQQTMLGANMKQYGRTIRAHYWPYGIHDKAIVRRNVEFAKKHQLVYLSDLSVSGGHIYPSKNPKYHMSGHARPEDTLAFVNRLANSGVLRQVVPIHGEARRFAAQEIRKQHSEIVVYDRFEKKGYTINLFVKD